MFVPICAKDPRPDYPRTFAVRLDCVAGSEDVVKSILGKLVNDKGNNTNCSNYGLVYMPDAIFFLVTDPPGTSSQAKNRRAHWKNEVAKATCPKTRHKLMDLAKITVSQFDRRLQRYFGWGDAFATREDVVAACKKGDQAELLTLMPNAAEVSNLAIMPQVFDAIAHGPPAITDETQVETDKELMRALHEIGKHEFGEPLKNAECTLCSEMYAMRCPCGVQRCQACVHRHTVAPKLNNWDVFHINAQPFLVVDLAALSDKAKRAWLLEELGDYAGNLTLFAMRFHDLFGRMYSRFYDKKYACLKVFNLRLEGETRAYIKYEELAIEQQEEFLQALDPAHPNLCRACGRDLPEGNELFHSACVPAPTPAPNRPSYPPPRDNLTEVEQLKRSIAIAEAGLKLADRMWGPPAKRPRR